MTNAGEGLPGSAPITLASGASRARPQATLVLGFDRDEASHAALAVGMDMAERLEADLAVVHIVNLGDYPISPEAPDWEERAQEALAEERHDVEQALVGHRFGWSYEARYGSPVHTLIDVAEERDALMIIVGRHGDGVSEGLRRLIDGSVSRRLVKTATRPILVVNRHRP